MPFIKIPTPMRPYVNGQSRVNVSGRNVAEAMESLLAQFPALRPHLAKSNGEYRAFVNLFIGEINIRDLQGFETELDVADELRLVPSIAGG
jgi:molybdopterin converting factor small subunit